MCVTNSSNFEFFFCQCIFRDCWWNWPPLSLHSYNVTSAVNTSKAFFQGPRQTFWFRDRVTPTLEKRWDRRKKNLIDSKEEITLYLTQSWTFAWVSWIASCTTAVAIDDIDQNRGYYETTTGPSVGTLKPFPPLFRENLVGIFLLYLRGIFPIWQNCDITSKGLINRIPASCWQTHWGFRGARDTALAECCYLSSRGWQLLFTRALNIKPISRPEMTEVKIRKRYRERQIRRMGRGLREGEGKNLVLLCPLRVKRA